MVRKRDPLWDAWVAEWGEPQTADERGRINAALKQLRDINATPEQITRALRAYDEQFNAVRSPQGVTGNWTVLTSSPSRQRWGRQETCQHGVSFFERCEKCIREGE